MATIFRTIEGRVVPINVTKVTSRTSKQKVSRITRPKNFKNSASQYSSAKSFTNPNATCPVCGAEVYYYEHPNGARVYFDELGPPWLKHPCTDSPSFKIPRKKKAQPTKSALTWQDSKWSPLIIDKTVLIEEGRGVRVQASSSTMTVRFELNSILLKRKHCKVEAVNQLVMLAKNDGKKARISITSGLESWDMYGDLVNTNIQTKASPSDKLMLSKSQEIPTIEVQKLLDEGFQRVPVTKTLSVNHVTFELFIHGYPLSITRKKKAKVKWLFTDSREFAAWWRKTKKGAIKVYIRNTLTKQFIQQGFSEPPVTPEPVSEPISTVWTSDIQFQSLAKSEDLSLLYLIAIGGKHVMELTFSKADLLRLVTIEKLMFGEDNYQLSELSDGSYSLFCNGKKLELNTSISVSDMH